MLVLVKIVHFVAMTLGLGGSVANLVIGARTKASPPEVRRAAGPIQVSIGRISFVSLIFLWLSGVYLVSAAGGADEMPALFWLKLIAVLTLTAAAVVIQMLVFRAARGTPPNPAVMSRLGLIAAASAFVALILAAMAFT